MIPPIDNYLQTGFSFISQYNSCNSIASFKFPFAHSLLEIINPNIRSFVPYVMAAGVYMDP